MSFEFSVKSICVGGMHMDIHPYFELQVDLS